MVGKSKEEQTGQSWSSKKASLRSNKRKLVIGFLVLVVLVTTGYLLFPRVREFVSERGAVKSDCAKSSSNECQLLKESVKLFDGSKVQELSKVVEKIKKTSNYKRNPNLIYALVIYDINIGDGSTGRQDLNDLKKAYDKTKAYDPLLVELGAVKPEALDSQIKFLEDQKSQVQKNNWGVTSDGNTQSGSKR